MFSAKLLFDCWDCREMTYMPVTIYRLSEMFMIHCSLFMLRVHLTLKFWLKEYFPKIQNTLCIIAAKKMLWCENDIHFPKHENGYIFLFSLKSVDLLTGFSCTWKGLSIQEQKEILHCLLKIRLACYVSRHWFRALTIYINFFFWEV